MRLMNWLNQRTLTGAVALVITMGLAVAFQSPRPVPPFEGDGNPDHDGQPVHCQNFDSTAYLHNCECMAMADDPKCEEKSANTSSENPKCKVYCRKTACRCKKKCRSTE